jgi:hypothetical protein
MYDFRSPPQFVINNETGEKLPTNYQGIAYYPPGANIVGTYYICCSGSHYEYFDGHSWYYDGLRYWQHTNERPPQFTRYSFEW